MRTSLGLAAVLLWTGLAHAETLSVAAYTANLHSQPDRNSMVVLQAPRWYPLEVKGDQGEFYQVEDYRGRTAWIVKLLLKPVPGAVVTGSRVNVRSGPGLNHGVSFQALQGVAFKVLETKGDWVKIQHESGKSGWIAKSLVWTGS